MHGISSTIEQAKAVLQEARRTKNWAFGWLIAIGVVETVVIVAAILS